jgi:ABC-type transport system involved in multi-copper enzyme maturation permease subunit
MIGPVLTQELLLGSRRRRLLLFRRIYAAWLVVQFLFFYWLYLIDTNLVGVWFFKGRLNAEALQGFAPPLVEKLVYQHFLLLLLATPAFTAGAITDEKVSGTLEYLFAADLTSWEILMGKLLGRVSQVAMLGLVVLPVLCFIGVFGGLSLIQLLGLVAVTAGPLLGLGAASLLASVWCRQTRDAVLSVYLSGAAAGCLLWVAGGLYLFDPFYVLESAWGDLADLAELARRLILSLLTWGTIAGICLAIAGWRLRPTYLRQLEGAGRPRKVRWWIARRAPVGDQPIRWKERYVDGVAPLSWMRRLPRWCGIASVSLLTVVASLASILAVQLLNQQSWKEIIDAVIHLRFSQPWFAPSATDGAFLTQGIAALLIATLLIGLRCSGAITGERERQTWEALLLTPLPAPQLVRGKIWGIVGASYPYLLAYLIPVLVFSILAGGWAPIYSVLLMLVTWLAMAFVGSAGLWCSVRSKGSWRSLLWTFLIGYAGGAGLYLFAWPVAGIMWLAVLLTLVLLDLVNGNQTTFAQTFRAASGFFVIGVLLGLIGGFILAIGLFLRSAQKYIALRERIRQDRRVPPVSPLRRRRREPPVLDVLPGPREPG